MNVLKILIGDDGYMQITESSRIMQGSHNASKIEFIVKRNFNTNSEIFDLSMNTCIMKYLLPNELEPKIIELTNPVIEAKTEEDYLRYTYMCDAHFTSKGGVVAIALGFYIPNIDNERNDTSIIRKTTTLNINITPADAWTEVLPNSFLTTLDKKIQTIAQYVNSMKAYAADITGVTGELPDDLVFDDNDILHLSASGKILGTGVDVGLPTMQDNEDGVVDGVIDFDKIIENLKN